MIRIVSVFLLIIFLVSCKDNKEHIVSKAEHEVDKKTEIKNPKSDVFYQYSIWFAFVNKVFDGDLKVSELKTKGDIGLGSFDYLDGELVMLDGVPYRIRENGEISVGQDEDEIVYADATFFNEDGVFQIEGPVDYPSFQNKLNTKMESEHYFYAYRVPVKLDYVKLGGVPKVEKPFKDGLDVLLPIRPVFEAENISGTLVGFYCPEYIGNINAFGHHFHFISDDRKWGGHVMEFKTTHDIDVPWDQKTSYAFDLPKNKTFEGVKLDSEFQYN
ncbi:acetolactate decarboxylase [Hyunsoonleella flava]|uniref:Alpha-acetolactate decarboxylase n=1 Tax=Hyunsoonleella flava TaxID=2527939 RepID=A0A4Q9FIU3_9FLAO|nr:acetolactate decarboxylase [Hyunsoonleella flava]TBN02955.1 acetolactate decarboxylase [Hyunsoonleella flava]